MSMEAVNEPVTPMPPVTGDDRVHGGPDARATLVVYGNYSCLHCRRAYAMLAELAGEAGPALRVAYRHFARPDDFPDAERAAAAAGAAAAQGRFWAMHRRLATAAPFFDDGALLAHAAGVGLDVRRFAADLRDEGYRTRLRAEHAAGAAAGVAATPSFFVDGAAVADRWDLDALRARVVDAVRG